MASAISSTAHVTDEKLDHLQLSINPQIHTMIGKYGVNTPRVEQVVFSDFVTKINKRGKEQTRTFLLTTKGIYNLIPSNLYKCKRRIAILKIDCITASAISDEFVLHISDEYDYRFKSAKKDRIVEQISLMYTKCYEEEKVSFRVGSLNVNGDNTNNNVAGDAQSQMVKGIGGIRIQAPHAATPRPPSTAASTTSTFRSAFGFGSSSKPTTARAKPLRKVLLVQYVHDTELKTVTITKQMARMNVREEMLMRRKVLAEADNDSDKEEELKRKEKLYKSFEMLEQKESNDTPKSQSEEEFAEIQLVQDNAPFSPNSTLSLSATSPIELDKQQNSTDKSSNKNEHVTLKDFELLKVLGRGSFGKVMLVRKRDNQKCYAMKILKKQAIIARNQVEHTKAERKILQSLQHPFLMRLRYAFQSDTKLYFVLHYYPGGELFFHLKKERRFSERIAKLFVAEIALAIGHLHSLGIIYRDLKPENILLDKNGFACLTDFGLSKDVSGEESENDAAKAHTFCGTPEYLAPEIIVNRGHNQAVDWWSIGILLYELTVGIPPFYSQNVQEMYSKIQTGVLRFPPFLSEDCRALIVALLHRNPNERLGSKNDIEDIKAHAFFKDLDWNKLIRKEIAIEYRPNVVYDGDTANFDTAFTNEPVEDSVVVPTNGKRTPSIQNSHNSQNEWNVHGQDDGTQFDEFSYVARKSTIAM